MIREKRLPRESLTVEAGWPEGRLAEEEAGRISDWMTERLTDSNIDRKGVSQQ